MLKKTIAEDLIARVREAINLKNEIAILSHIGPDGDSVGSSLALCHYLRALGKKVQLVIPNAMPDFLDWLPGVDEIIVYEKNRVKADQLLSSVDLIFILDLNTPSRLGPVEQALAKTSVPRILIDHHLFPADFTQVAISHPEISSTSELIFRLICRLGDLGKISLDCAQCILTGMMTDTGGFSYNSNDPEIYIIVAELLKIGVNKDEIYRKVFNSSSLDRLKLRAFSIYEKMDLVPAYNTALIAISAEDLKNFNYKVGDTEGIVNIPLGIQGVLLSVFMRQEKDEIRISFRSHGSFPANKVAEDLFGGGGHLNAAGAESKLGLAETLEKIKEALPRYAEFFEAEKKAEELKA